MYYVPYAHNYVTIYGAVVALEKSIGAQEVCVDVLIETAKGEEAKPVRLLNRRALEMLAFYQANQQMYPNEPFLVTLLGHLHVEQDCCMVIGDSVAFNLTPDVRTWGAQMVRLTLQHHKQTYGPQPWLESFDSGSQSDAPNDYSTPDAVVRPANDSTGRRQKQRTRG